MGASEILVSGGVAAVLAAVAGGGLKAFGVELPLLATVKRQMLVMIVGAGLIALGLMSGAGMLKAPAAGDDGPVQANAAAAATNAASGPAPDSNQAAAAETPAPAAPAAAPVSAARANLPPVDDLPITTAREMLMKLGWVPISMGNPMHNENVQFGNGPALVEKGIKELRACAGSGMAECVFAYRDQAGRVLRVVTRGESDDPRVDDLWILDCSADPRPEEC